MEDLLAKVEKAPIADLPSRSADIQLKVGCIWLKERVMLFANRNNGVASTWIEQHKTTKVRWESNGSKLSWLTDRNEWMEFKPNTQKDFQHGLAEFILLGDYTDSNV